ncbi:MAG TPA: hypothetical protein VN043_03655 [Rhodanobacter sp.]|nr:hypothetical protein [Rhodanobacter sp.]
MQRYAALCPRLAMSADTAGFSEAHPVELHRHLPGVRADPAVSMGSSGHTEAGSREPGGVNGRLADVTASGRAGGGTSRTEFVHAVMVVIGMTSRSAGDRMGGERHGAPARHDLSLRRRVP